MTTPHLEVKVVAKKKLPTKSPVIRMREDERATRIYKLIVICNQMKLNHTIVKVVPKIKVIIKIITIIKIFRFYTILRGSLSYSIPTTIRNKINLEHC